MDVEPKDVLLIKMQLLGSIWIQDVFDMRSGKSVRYQKNMERQTQNIAEFAIEPTSLGLLPLQGITFTDTALSFSGSDPANCTPQPLTTDDDTKGGATATATTSTPFAINNGEMCFISTITLGASNSQKR